MRSILAAVLSACLATSAAARAPLPKPPQKSREEFGPPCLTVSQALANVARHPEVKVRRADGSDAAELLRQINQVGTPTDYHAETLILVFYDDHIGIGLFDACHMTDLAMSIAGFKEVLDKVAAERA